MATAWCIEARSRRDYDRSVFNQHVSTFRYYLTRFACIAPTTIHDRFNASMEDNVEMADQIGRRDTDPFTVNTGLEAFLKFCSCPERVKKDGCSNRKKFGKKEKYGNSMRRVDEKGYKDGTYSRTNWLPMLRGFLRVILYSAVKFDKEKEET
ncbi:hypothetical protein WN48_09595 [Eufriesea mexicana]|uniref:Uncharacterized protein n=1 Tax=Eufriesea mexicana TaxID=516756 RepID=A0A310S9X2_9HYME|nr:hypothetical protein WN48_09595 [Eufriesea mexicana]